MGLNHSYGIDQKKTRSKGKLYHTIDFELNESYSNENFIKRDTNIALGTLFIGDKVINLTLDECKRIQETMHAAVETTEKKYKLGLLAK